MDQITRALLSEFINQNTLTASPESSQFEHFVGYLTTQKHYNESFSTDDVVVGAGGDTGIDAIAIIANGSLITEPDEIEDYATTNGYLDVTFVFAQAETSSAFDTSKIGQFGYGVVDFFADTPTLQSNDKIKHLREIWKRILAHSKHFKHGNPQCYLYYATTGKWTDDQNLMARRDGVKKDLENTGLFRNIAFECIGATGLQELYRHSKNAISAEINFSARTVIPEVQGVQEAYIGLLPATEFLKLVVGPTGEIRSSIFYDNVRHWQEWNAVNKEMEQTLSDDNTKVLFPLLNNGVTIVARRVHPTGNKFTIEDYQIVNGCQTSFVLYHNKDHLDASVTVPLRIIATQDENIKNSIIKATNRQTQVTDDQFFALAEFPKKLEAYFPTFTNGHGLFYERRPGQYNADTDVERVRIVTQTMLIRAFASMFLDLPHRATRNFKSLLQQVGTNIFQQEHRLEPYYVAAYVNYKMDYFFRNQTLNTDLKPARYHLLLATRLLAAPASLPPFNSRDMEKYCTTFMKILWDNDACKKIFETAGELIRKVANGEMHGDNVRTEAFTQALVSEIEAQTKKAA